MAKIRDPISFSKHFGLDRKTLRAMGAFDPMLAVDTKLFIDPLLLRASKVAEFSDSGARRFDGYFQDVLDLLKASKTIGDVAWREAKRRLRFPEVRHTCLGYGAASIHGSAFGSMLSDRLITTAKEIIDLGVDDPKLFMLLPLLEEGIGPDRISDMTTNVVLPDLMSYTERVCRALEVVVHPFTILGHTGHLPENAQEPGRPILLVARDVLRQLPIATDWDDVMDAAHHNELLRRRLNAQIGTIWTIRTRKDKERLRDAVLSKREAAETVIEAIFGSKAKPYDFTNDPLGRVLWRSLETIAQENPRTIAKPTGNDVASVLAVVREIVATFQHLVETRGVWKFLWRNGDPHREDVAQLIFFMVAYSYCEANGLDLSPEADTGSGVVDFKLSLGRRSKVLVETKLSTNHRLVHGYATQLPTYMASEKASKAIYLVVDVGRMGRKEKDLAAAQKELKTGGQPVHEIVYVDGRKKKSASRR